MLTRALAERCGRLVAVEIDEGLFVELRAAFRDDPHVVLVHDDFLRHQLPDGPYKVFASVPCNRTAAIIRRLADAPVPPDDAYCIVQREAAERFCGTPHASETRSSLLLKPWFQVEI